VSHNLVQLAKYIFSSNAHIGECVAFNRACADVGSVWAVTGWNKTV